MALQLIKLYVGAATTTEVAPVSSKYFYINDADVAAGATLTIGAADFIDDTGTVGVTLPELTANNSYFRIYINGVLQENGNATYTPGAAGTGSLAFLNPAGGDSILQFQPVILEVVRYSPTSTTVITT